MQVKNEGHMHADGKNADISRKIDSQALARAIVEEQNRQNTAVTPATKYIAILESVGLVEMLELEELAEPVKSVEVIRR